MKLKYLGIFLMIFLLGIVHSQDNIPEAILTFSMPRIFDVYQDTDNNFVITVKNDGSITLHNVAIVLSGIPENSYSISPNSLDSLDLSQSSHFSVSIYAQNITPGIHDLTVMMKSDETSETVTITLNVKWYNKERGELIKKNEEAEPVLETTKNSLIAIMVLSGSILIITCIRLFTRTLYSKNGKE